MSPQVMNQIQRDAIRILLPDFKTAGYKGQGDENPYTDHLKPGAYLEKKLKGYTLPNFDDMLHGLQYLPSGSDAKGLTHCLAWYQDICSSFTPKLELNVLHTQALICALRLPLNQTDSKNWDQFTLTQWRAHGRAERAAIADVKSGNQYKKKSTENSKHCSKSQAVFNIYKDPIDLSMHVNVPIRHILGFPFLALHGIVCEAFQMGIAKAECRRVARKGLMTPPKTAKPQKDEEKVNQQRTRKRRLQTDTVNEVQSVHTPKRQRTLDASREWLVVRTPKRPTVSPITPRTSKYGHTSNGLCRPTIKLETSPLKSK